MRILFTEHRIHRCVARELMAQHLRLDPKPLLPNLSLVFENKIYRYNNFRKPYIYLINHKE